MAKIEIPLDIPDVEIESVGINSKGDIVITVKSTVEGTRCHKCGRKITKLHCHDREITLRHLSILGRNVYIRIRPARYQCTHCSGNPTTTQKLQWYEPRSPHTTAYEEHVLRELVNSTVSDVRIKEDLGYEAVMGIIQRHIKTEVEWSEIERLDEVGIDEISLKKGHKDFVTVVTARTGGRIIILAVLNGRKKSTVKAFLTSIPKRLKKTVLAVCSDLYEGYINAAKEVFGTNVIVVVDRFHIAKLYRNGLDELRKKEMKHLKKELSKEEYKKLKGAMWILRKDIEELTGEDLDVLKWLFKYAPILELAYKLRNELTDIFEGDHSKSEAKRKINRWKERVIKSGLSCFNSFLSILDNWLDERTE